MSITKLNVVNTDGLLSKELFGNTKILVNDLTVIAEPKQSEALLIDDTIIIIGNKNVTEHSKIYITNPKVFINYVDKFDSNMKKDITHMKKELNLNQTEMKELMNFYNTEKKRLEGKKDDLRTRLALIRRQAEEIKRVSIEKGLIGKLVKKNVEINSVMDEIIYNKVRFTVESTEEVISISENLIKDVHGFLGAMRDSYMG